LSAVPGDSTSLEGTAGGNWTPAFSIMPGVLGFHVRTHVLSIKKAPKGISESLGAYPIGIFWETHFINPPEV